MLIAQYLSSNYQQLAIETASTSAVKDQECARASDQPLDFASLNNFLLEFTSCGGAA